MSDNSDNFTGRVDMKVFLSNKPRVPLADLVPHYGKYVAWRGDGTGIAASADTDEALDRELERLGIGLDEVVFDYLDDA